jgi:hypothetical protein
MAVYIIPLELSVLNPSKECYTNSKTAKLSPWSFLNLSFTSPRSSTFKLTCGVNQFNQMTSESFSEV